MTPSLPLLPIVGGVVVAFICAAAQPAAPGAEAAQEERAVIFLLAIPSIAVIGVLFWHAHRADEKSCQCEHCRRMRSQ